MPDTRDWAIIGIVLAAVPIGAVLINFLSGRSDDQAKKEGKLARKIINEVEMERNKNDEENKEMPLLKGSARHIRSVKRKHRTPRKHRSRRA